MSCKILVVDDSRDLLDAYHAALESVDGYHVLSARSVDDAVELARSWCPDLILTDISMPGRSGFDLITQIRSDLRPPLPKIGVISGFPDFEREALVRGASAFELKPIGAACLRAFVEGLLGSRDCLPGMREGVLRQRRAVSAAADAAFLGTLARFPDFLDRVRLATRVLSRYFDGATVLVLLVREGVLRVVASSDPEQYPGDSPVDGLLGYAAEVIESGASLLVPDVQTREALRRASPSAAGLLVSTPFYAPDGRPIGSLTIIGDRESAVDAIDLAIAEHAAHRGSEILGGSEPSGLLAGAHLFSREMWRGLLRLELSRVRSGCAVGIALLEPGSVVEGPGCEVWLESLSSRMALGEFEPGIWALFKIAEQPGEVRDALETTLDAIARSVGVRRAAAFTFSGFDPPERPGALIDIARAAFDTAARRPHGTVLHVRLAPEEEAPRPDRAEAGPPAP